MNASVVSKVSDVADNAVVATALFEGEDSASLPFLSPEQSAQLAALLNLGPAVTRRGTTTLLPAGRSARPVLVVGAGKRGDVTALNLKRGAAVASRYLTGLGFSHIAYVARSQMDGEAWGQASLEGALEGAYDSAIKKTSDRTPRRLDTVTLVSTSDGVESGVRVGQIVGEARDIARELVNLPPNELTPTVLAERAQELASRHGLECSVLDENQIEHMGMGALLGVAAGSKQPPRLITLRYGSPDARKRVAFAGKGLTFDSGGLSLKTGEGMETMKSDMAGAAAVIAGMVAVARLQPQGVCVTGYVGTTENMPGGGAMRPGDVLTAMNGKTIEVLNTDAEGRLVLADVLSYAVKQGETHIVDFATLTGAAVVALGHAAALATGKPMSWVEDVVKASDSGLDRAWAMPLYPEYRRAMDSTIADLKNTGGRSAGAGALTAAAFLSEFAEGAEWTHMDIAGMAFNREGSSSSAPGGTGTGVGTIAAVTRSMASSAAQE
ncbi:MAG TPA: leucyl aminopeptidase [Chloroflexota bacterium]|nr:leucyl aminopeptidase [Chloroflexota bacterium]